MEFDNALPALISLLQKKFFLSSYCACYRTVWLHVALTYCRVLHQSIPLTFNLLGMRFRSARAYDAS